MLACCLLATGTISLAAEVQVKPKRQHAAPAKPQVLVVPDVRHQVFVFAKGMLEDDGFGWQVKGSVHGYAPNRVISQSPTAGTRVVDTGSPKITLELDRDNSYPERGTAEDHSPYSATAITLMQHAKPKAVAAKAAAAKAAAAKAAAAKTAAAKTAAAKTAAAKTAASKTAAAKTIRRSR